MNAKLLKCKGCGKVYAVGNLDTRDGHRCECGITLDAWGNYFGKCETAENPNRPWSKEDGKPNNVKLNEMDIRLNREKCPALVMINESGEVKAIPIFSKDTELLVFRTVTPYREEGRDRLSEEYTVKTGIKCVVIDARTELVAVQNG